MRRRKPYAELPGVGLSVARGTKVGPPVAVPPPQKAPPTLKPETVRRYSVEIRNLSLMVDHHRLTADADGQKMCTYTEEKLKEASHALERGDEEASWFCLFGAAKLCRSFDIQPEKADRALQRIRGLLSDPQ